MAVAVATNYRRRIMFKNTLKSFFPPSRSSKGNNGLRTTTHTTSVDTRTAEEKAAWEKDFLKVFTEVTVEASEERQRFLNQFAELDGKCVESYRKHVELYCRAGDLAKASHLETAAATAFLKKVFNVLKEKQTPEKELLLEQKEKLVKLQATVLSELKEIIDELPRVRAVLQVRYEKMKAFHDSSTLSIDSCQRAVNSTERLLSEITDPASFVALYDSQQEDCDKLFALLDKFIPLSVKQCT